MDEFVALFWSCVGIVMTGLMTWATTTLVAWLNSKIKDKKLAQYSTDITNIILSAVQSIMQTYVDALKKQGKFDQEAANEAKQKCIKIINTQLSAELTNYIATTFGDVESYIESRVEAMIYNIKK